MFLLAVVDYVWCSCGSSQEEQDEAVPKGDQRPLRSDSRKKKVGKRYRYNRPRYESQQWSVLRTWTVEPIQMSFLRRANVQRPSQVINSVCRRGV